MNFKKFMLSLSLIMTIAACNNKKHIDQFTVSGNLKNVGNQKIYLDQLYFSDKSPDVLDTGILKDGMFSLEGKANEEGLFRIRFENNGAALFFINDINDIKFNADLSDLSLKGFTCNTPANQVLKNFMLQLEKSGGMIDETTKILDSLKQNDNDSLVAIETKKMENLQADFKNYISKFIDTCSSPVVTMFSIGYIRNFDPATFNKSINNLTKRFPEHKQIASVVDQYNKMIAEMNKPKASAPGTGANIGSIAPEITMNDVDGKSFSLSQLRGKYVLVDFWASWCGPCRGENPYVVAAYQKFKNKNFTVLGVSLDEDKTAWLKAIKDDKLEWKQISDLKGWSTAAVALYGFDGIPFNVLLDPTGKIIAKELREDDLGKFLEKTLK